jgi:type I restriction enzyme M protein
VVRVRTEVRPTVSQAEQGERRTVARSLPKSLHTRQSVDTAVKAVCDIMRRSNCAGALQYVPELTWILFLRILDEREQEESDEAAALGLPFTASLAAPYRWRDWAAPPDGTLFAPSDVAVQGWKRRELQERTLGAVFAFVNGELLPHLRALRDRPGATPRQRMVGEVMASVERVRIDTEKNLLDVLDKVHEITNEGIDPTHVFALSQIYEGLLLKMGEKGSDAGQFFTPREVIRALVRAIAPKIGETVYDPCCGTGGFLAQAAEYMQPKIGAKVSGPAIARFRQETFWGREKENLIYPIGLANLILHGIDRPNIWHGNALTGDEVYGGLFAGAPTQFDVILTNPPFGGKENKQAQTSSDYKTSATQVLFLQHVIRALRTDGGRCGMVIDEGVLFRTNEDAFVKTKRKLTDECDLWCILSLPGGVFSAAGAGVKTNLLVFTKGKPTEKIWYYDLSDVKVGKKTPLTLKHFEDFAAKLATREDSDRSWTVDLSARRAKAAADAQPSKDTARAKSQEAERARDRLGELKRTKPRDEPAIADTKGKIRGFLKQAREATNKAEGIENAVYDLKAVNPHRKAEVDRRTPAELLDLVEAKGREVAEALATLRALPSPR